MTDKVASASTGAGAKRTRPVDLLLVIPPANSEQIMPELGPAQLEGHLEALGFNVRQLDLNQAFLNANFQRLPAAYRPKPDIAPFYPLRQRRVDQLCELAAKPHPLYDPFFERWLFQPWTGPAPRVLGVSILSAEQMIPALRLGALARRYWREIPVIWGGPYAAPGRKVLNRFLEDGRLAVDGFVVFGGERPLEHLLEGGKGVRERFAKTPSFAYRTPDGIRETAPSDQIVLDRLDPPCFDQLPFDLYLAPLLPVPTTSGCYHNRCKFCHHRIVGTRFDAMGGQLVAERMIELAGRYNLENFFLADYCTKPQTMEEIARVLLETGHRFRFSAMARADTGFTQKRCRTIEKAGGRMLLVGLESADAGFLQFMDKGITAEQVEEVCVNAAEAGLYVVLFVLDIPSRPAEEMLKTVQWVMERSEIIHDVVYQRFALSRDILRFSDVDVLGIEPEVEPDEWADVYDIPYRPRTPRKAAEEQAVEQQVRAMMDHFWKKRKVPTGRGSDIWCECTTL